MKCRSNKKLIPMLLEKKGKILNEIHIRNDYLTAVDRTIKLFTPVTPEQSIKNLINKYPQKEWSIGDFRTHLRFISKLEGLKTRSINLNYIVERAIKKLIEAKDIEAIGNNTYSVTRDKCPI